MNRQRSIRSFFYLSILCLFWVCSALSCSPQATCPDGGNCHESITDQDSGTNKDIAPDCQSPGCGTPSCANASQDCSTRACCPGLLCDSNKRCTSPSSGPVKVEKGEFFYRLQQSSSDLLLWTAPNVEKVLATTAPPTTTSNILKVYSAKHEFEPFQLQLRPTTTMQVQVRWSGGTTLGKNARWRVDQIGFVKGYPETLTPITNGAKITLTKGQNTGLWWTVYVPPDAPSGPHSFQIQLKAGTRTWQLPVQIHVFDFALPKDIHFYSQMNLSMGSLMDGQGSYQEQLDRAKSFMFEHRFTPKAPIWPSGFSYKITWDNDKNPQRCKQFYDEPTEGPPYSVKHLAARYAKGVGWNDGVGFPSFMLFQFVDNATPRPASFCNIPRGSSHEGTDAYNDAYGRFLKGLETYLIQEKMIGKAYYYVQNEPQNQKDHALAAHLCRLFKKAAPRLQLAISEEPKPEIFNDPKGSCGYDIWIAHIRAYAPVYKVAWQRQIKHKERVWWYSLDHDSMPYFNPTLVERPGIDCRIIPWLAWKYRVEGWAYYNMGAFLKGRQPTIRFELMREGFEDYEYLWLANAKAHPIPEKAAIPDKAVERIASSLTSFTRDAAAITKLRLELGRYLGGERKDLPLIEVGGQTERKAVYINFQDPKGEPNQNPLTVDGKTYIKVGWEAFDEKKGWGWYGQYIDNPKITKSQWLSSPSTVNVLQRSILYDDYGRKNTFEINVANGKYDVTVSVGWHGKTYAHHQVWIEGVQVIKDEKTDASNKHYIVRTITVDVKDGKLTLEAGGKSPLSKDFEYTMLNSLTIVPK